MLCNFRCFSHSPTNDDDVNSMACLLVLVQNEIVCLKHPDVVTLALEMDYTFNPPVDGIINCMPPCSHAKLSGRLKTLHVVICDAHPQNREQVTFWVK